MTSHEAIHKQLTLNAKLKIRVAKASDISKLEWDGQFTHFRNLFRRAYSGQRRGNRLMLVMDFNGYPIGRLFIQFINPTRFETGIKRGYIYSFTVMQAFRGLGIGTHMLKTAESILIKGNYPIATISVAKTNKRAYQLYLREGYEIYGEDDGQWQYRDHEGKTHHVDEPSWLMKKSLIPSLNNSQTIT